MSEYIDNRKLQKGLGKGLGKGLDLLIGGDYNEEERKDSYQDGGESMVKLRLIESNSSQPRTTFEEEGLQELADSIRKYGILQPLLLQKRGERYLIIAGERRWRAARLAGLTEVPAIVRECTEQEIAEISLIENLQREDLNPVEEARAYQSLIETYQLKQEEIAERVSKSRTVITNSLRLLKLDEPVLDLLAEGKISVGHAKVLLGLPRGELQQKLAEDIAEKQLSVRETEKMVKGLLEHKEPAPKKAPVVLSNQELYRSIEEKMKNRTGTQVKILRKDENKGKIEIDYYSSDDLEKIMGIFNL